MSTKLEKFVTPIGEAKWAHIQKPKAAFMERGQPKGEPKYQIDVVFDKDDPQWEPWAAKIMAEIRAMPQQIDKKTKKPIEKQVPIKAEYDEKDEPTGRFFVTFKTGAKFKPGVFDKYGQIIPEETLIGNGSKVRVNYCSTSYEGFGGGIAFYLNAVQVMELVEYHSATAENYGFGTEKPPEGGFPEGGATDAPEGEASADDDKIPF